MSRIVSSILLLAAAVLSSCARPNMRVTAADGPCEIEGTVVYEDGRPANHATVLTRAVVDPAPRSLSTPSNDRVIPIALLLPEIALRLHRNLLPCFSRSPVLVGKPAPAAILGGSPCEFPSL
jgi:hypothetical protein